jgi:uncharacterized protein YndB with AHSA1/START domain
LARARRTLTIAAAPQRVWELLADPHHMPRWWPGVQRMEDVCEDRFTQVFLTRKARPVRVDLRLLASEPPDPHGSGRRCWEQELAGTPFQRVLNESITEVWLEPEADGVRVTIEQRQRLRGYSRTGGFLLRRATGAKLDQALEGLRGLCA